MLARLMNDHKHIAILLRVLKTKYAKLANGDAINFNVVRDIVEYMQSYTEHSHHPLEEVVCEFYWNKLGQPRPDDRLVQEHQKLTQATASLMTMLNLILSDVVVSREELISDLEAYVKMQQSHIEYEENEVFPRWSEGLDAQDWQTIKSLCDLKLIDDPLFSESDKVLFEELRDYLQSAEER